MSDEGLAAAQEPVQGEEKPKIDVEKLLSRVKQLEATNHRLLEESKSHKEAKVQYKSELEAKQEAELLKEKNFEELLKVKENRLSELSGQLENMKKSSMKKDLKMEIARHASDAHDINDIWQSIPKDMIAYNESTMSFEGVEDAVGKLRDGKSYLFKREKVPSMTSDRPGPAKKQEVDTSELLKTDPDAVWGEALKNADML